jgi:hypothetical protein
VMYGAGLRSAPGVPRKPHAVVRRRPSTVLSWAPFHVEHSKSRPEPPKTGIRGWRVRISRRSAAPRTHVANPTGGSTNPSASRQDRSLTDVPRGTSPDHRLWNAIRTVRARSQGQVSRTTRRPSARSLPDTRTQHDSRRAIHAVRRCATDARPVRSPSHPASECVPRAARHAVHCSHVRCSVYVRDTTMHRLQKPSSTERGSYPQDLWTV